MPTYTYSISADTANGAVTASSLDREIRSDSSVPIELVGLTVSGDVLSIEFQADLSPSQESSLSSIVFAHQGLPANKTDTPVTSDGIPIVSLPRLQPGGIPQVALVPRKGSELILATHNFCDRKSWYQYSSRVDEDTCSEISPGVWKPSLDVSFIDMYHGKVFREHIYRELSGHKYKVLVSVDGVEKVERLPFSSSGGDYVVDYINGTVSPTSENWTGSEVLCSFSHPTIAHWVLRPEDGRSVSIEKAEIQFSTDIEFTANLYMQVWGYVDIFAPDLIGNVLNPLTGQNFSPGDRLPIENPPITYTSLDQLVDEAVASYPAIPAMSASTGRGFSHPKQIFQFHYATERSIFSSLGMEIHFYTEGDVEYGGERATATFYCTSAEDPGVEQALSLLSG